MCIKLMKIWQVSYGNSSNSCSELERKERAKQKIAIHFTTCFLSLCLMGYNWPSPTSSRALWLCSSSYACIPCSKKAVVFNDTDNCMTTRSRQKLLMKACSPLTRGTGRLQQELWQKRLDSVRPQCLRLTSHRSLPPRSWRLQSGIPIHRRCSHHATKRRPNAFCFLVQLQD